MDAHDDTFEPVSGAKEIGALAHLYRGEVYRSTIWRQRLDTTTNWAVLTTGVALSISFSSPEASPLPIVLAGLLTAMFMVLEARRYRYFHVWKFRARILELAVYVPMLRGEGAFIPVDRGSVLSDDYENPQFRITMARALGRRIRRNYGYLFAVLGLAYIGKITIHPSDLMASNHILPDMVARAAVGPVPGNIAMILGVIFHISWVTLAIVTKREEVRDKSVVSDMLE